MDYLCNVEQQQTSSQKKLVTSNALPVSENLQCSPKNAGYVQKGRTSLLDQLLTPGHENNQHTTHNQDSVANEAGVNSLTAGEAISQHRERNVTSTDSKSKNEDITLSSLLGYPIGKTNFENRNNGTSQTTTTCSSRHVRVQHSFGVKMNIDTETSYLTFNGNCADTLQTSYVRDAPSGAETSRLFDGDVGAVNDGERLQEGEGNDMFYENGRESDDEENTQWWLNPERVHMGDVHRAVSEFLGGNLGYGLQTQNIKEEFIANETESVELNNLESSDILDSAFKRLVDSDYSTAVNESCRIQDNHRENVPIFVLSDDSNALSEGDETCRPTPSVSTSWGHMRLDTPISVNNKGGGINNGAVYTCNICDKVFSKLHTVQDHVRMHLGIRPYPCSRADCGKTFTSADNLNLHNMRNHHGVTSDTTSRPTVIYLRDADTDSVLNADAHMKPNNNKLEVFPCSKCGKEFANSNSLLKHIISHCKIKSYMCQSCGKSFPSYYAKLKHWRDINSSCYKLQYAVKKRSEIRRPSPVQTNPRANQGNNSKKKRYECKECDQKFAKERRLTDHVCFGTGADLYTCDTCSATFVRRSALTRHFKNHCVA